MATLSLDGSAILLAISDAITLSLHSRYILIVRNLRRLIVIRCLKRFHGHLVPRYGVD